VDIRGYSIGYIMGSPSYYSRFLGGRFEVANVTYQPYGFKFFAEWQDEVGWTGTWENIEWVPVEGVPFKFVDGWYPKYDIQLWLNKNNPSRRYLAPVNYELRPWIDGRDLNVFHHFQSPHWEHPRGAVIAPDLYGDFPPGVYKNSDLIRLGSPIFGTAIPPGAERLPEFPGFFVATEGPSTDHRVRPITPRSRSSTPH
jgi:hypothetical protein